MQQALCCFLLLKSTFQISGLDQIKHTRFDVKCIRSSFQLNTKTIVFFIVLFVPNPKVLLNIPLTTLNADAVAEGPDVIEHFTQLLTDC